VTHLLHDKPLVNHLAELGTGLSSINGPRHTAVMRNKKRRKRKRRERRKQQ
jgi:hypothetical protein